MFVNKSKDTLDCSELKPNEPTGARSIEASLRNDAERELFRLMFAFVDAGFEGLSAQGSASDSPPEKPLSDAINEFIVMVTSSNPSE